MMNDSGQDKLSPPVVDDSDPSSLSMAAARQRIGENLPTITEHESIDTRTATMRILATAIDSPVNLPSFRASAMDGYAIRHADRCDRLVVVDQSLAGHPGPHRMAAGTCQRITTGARVPDDADTVVQQENIVRKGEFLTVSVLPEYGLHVRAMGSDCSRGERLLAAGAQLGASERALLAAHGMHRVDVLRPLRVALFSTGDELVEPGDTLAEGQIYDANRPLLDSLLATPSTIIDDLGICPDSPAALSATLGRASNADVVVSSGGVSVGDADHVREAIEAAGDIALWKIAMKPGRPMTFGKIGNDQVYFGLPGNPVSAAVTALMFVRPALARMLGHLPADLPPLSAVCESTLVKRPGRVEYQRGVLSRGSDGVIKVTTTGIQDSHVLRSLQQANCFIELPFESSGVTFGDTVAVFPFTHFSAPLL